MRRLASLVTTVEQIGQSNMYEPCSSLLQSLTVRSVTFSCTSPHSGQLARIVVISGLPLLGTGGSSALVSSTFRRNIWGSAPSDWALIPGRVQATYCHSEVPTRSEREISAAASIRATIRPVSTRQTPVAFAHRGARTLEPENTIPAFRKALDQGATGLESDAWVSSDGQVVLVHDGVLRAGLRRVKVAETSALDLEKFGVPTLRALYEECGTEFELSIDIKDPGSASKMIEIASNLGVESRLWLCSPDSDFLATLREISSSIRLVHSPGRGNVVPATFERLASDLAEKRLNALNLHHSDWSKGVVSLIHRFELSSFAWDTQEIRHLNAAFNMGVDAVYCDRTDRMMTTLHEWQSRQILPL